MKFLDTRLVSYAPGVPVPNSQPLIALDFLIDENSVHIVRQVQTLSDILSMTGGLMGIVFAVTRVFLQKF